MGVTETADLLLELMLEWIGLWEDCAQELKKMADELESLQEKCYRGQMKGRFVSVARAVVTLLTGGAAAPHLDVAGACIPNLIEQFSSSETMKKGQKKEDESNNIKKQIERQFEQLKKELKELCPQMGPDDLDQHVMTAFMGAVGQRSGNSQVIRFLEDMSFDFGGGPTRHMRLQNKQGHLINVGMVEMIADIFVVFAFQLSGKKYKFLFDQAAERLVKTMSSTVFKMVLRGDTMAVGGAVGLVFALPEAINSWKEMIKNNHVTEASQSLRDTAKGILQMTGNLKEQLDNIREELQKLADVKWCIENTDRSVEDQRRVMQYAIEYCNDEPVRQWQMDMYRQNVFFGLLDMFDFHHQRRVIQYATSFGRMLFSLSDEPKNGNWEVFFGLVNMFNYLKDQLEQEFRQKKIDSGDIDITFVAHGAIEEKMISANCLVHHPSIKDVVLYSPWNCYLTAEAAYGIATGDIQPELREFLPSSNKPSNLPPYWNSMRRSGIDMIPVITVGSITPDNGEWKRFELLQTEHGEPGRNRVVLPFLFPEKVKVPFHIVTLALSLVLRFSYFRATVHLAACLGKASPRTRLNVWQLMEQYAYTEDGTAMTMSQVVLEPRFNALYEALKVVFNMTPAPHSWF